MIPSDFASYEAQARAEGFDEVLERRWPPATVLDTHSHPFALKALVIDGEIWLSVDGMTQHLQRGDAFTLERDIPHAERYEDAGAAYWVARRN